MVEVFKTNIQERKHASLLFEVLRRQFPLFKINFDLDDCDKILRIEGDRISNDRIMTIIHMNGYQCQVLE
ncbi:hypothetical protein [Emticicia sp. BO119]|uniref:hypothetical protein n=1 Tax=Emticicia sp. BO119 TaxID=2757768 RepID=UPI0015F0AF13|nr:hypothetical protein [Emticicia sp. BO119]MBA4853079.1 hypothetical protein [Emticicia sp. BO119]